MLYVVMFYVFTMPGRPRDWLTFEAGRQGRWNMP